MQAAGRECLGVRSIPDPERIRCRDDVSEQAVPGYGRGHG